MTWMKVDDNLHAHPKARRAGLEAMGLWTLAGSHASAYVAEGREGFVPSWWVETWPRGKTLAGRLVTAGLWTPETFDGEPGWRFHDWLDANPSWEQEQQRKAGDRERQARLRQGKKGARAARDTGQTSAASHGVTHAVSNGVSHALPTRPDPNPSSGRVSGGGSTQVTRTKNRPPRTCNQHTDNPTDAPCGPCKDARLAHDAWTPPVREVLRCDTHDTNHHGTCPGCKADQLAASRETA